MLVPVILFLLASSIFDVQCQNNDVDSQKQLPRLISALDASTGNDKSSVSKIPAENDGIERVIETSGESRPKRSPGGGGGCNRCGFNPGGGGGGGGGGHGFGGGGGGGGSWSKSSSSASSGSWGGGGGKYHGRK
ncbi:uncharacterized protein [Leptinotarsa decemlineata]|uniref:uncharacterized protein n=1 Tax=Leptinotarsa decemlineata TaxID=7539 RepID=UPI003D3070D1